MAPAFSAYSETPLCEEVYREDRIRLLYYRPPGGESLVHPLLVVYSLVNRYTILDLYPGCSMARSLLARGIGFYVLDWGYPAYHDRFSGINEHVCGYMDRIVDCIRHRHATSRIHLMGFCLGGLFSAIYASFFPRKIKSLVTVATPVDFSACDVPVYDLAKHMDAEQLVAALGNIPGTWISFCLVMLHPGFFMDRCIRLLKKRDDPVFVDHFLRFERWVADAPDIPGAVFSEFVTGLVRQNLLVRGLLVAGGRRVRPETITMPLLNIYCRYDRIAPPAACAAIERVAGAQEVDSLCIDSGHLGIFLSPECQALFAEKIGLWLKRQNGQGRYAAVAA